MPAKPKSSVDPALKPLIKALVDLVIERQAREMDEAAPEMAALRAMLGLDDDFPAWKRKVEGLMRAYYAHVPRSDALPLKDRLRLVAAAVEELGPTASYKRVAIRAGELAERERPPERARRRGQKPRSPA